MSNHALIGLELWVNFPMKILSIFLNGLQWHLVSLSYIDNPTISALSRDRVTVDVLTPWSELSPRSICASSWSCLKLFMYNEIAHFEPVESSHIQNFIGNVWKISWATIVIVFARPVIIKLYMHHCSAMIVFLLLYKPFVNTGVLPQTLFIPRKVRCPFHSRTWTEFVVCLLKNDFMMSLYPKWKNLRLRIKMVNCTFLLPSCRHLFLANHNIRKEGKWKQGMKITSWIRYWFKESKRYYSLRQNERIFDNTELSWWIAIDS